MAKVVAFRRLKVATPEEQVRWVELRTKQLLKRLPTLKKRLSLFDDKSNEFYNFTESEITLMSKVYMDEIRSGKQSEGFSNFAKNLQRFTQTSVKTLEKQYTNTRFDSWYKYAVENAVDDREVELIDKLVDSMSEEDKIAFTKSKYFFINDFSASSQLDAFEKEYEITIATAKLENFLDDRRGRTSTTTYDSIRLEMGKDKHKQMYKPRKRK